MAPAIARNHRGSHGQFVRLRYGVDDSPWSQMSRPKSRLIRAATHRSLTSRLTASLGKKMATFTGTSADEKLPPQLVSPTITSNPVGAQIGNGADTLNGAAGNDVLNGGGGA